MHHLAKITAKVKGKQYDGAMIIKAVWKKEALPDNDEPEIVKENRKMLVCKAVKSSCTFCACSITSARIGRTCSIVISSVIDISFSISSFILSLPLQKINRINNHNMRLITKIIGGFRMSLKLIADIPFFYQKRKVINIFSIFRKFKN